MNTVLQVEGMSCQHCVKAIEGSVGQLSGVESVKADVQAGTVAVSFEPGSVTLDEIKETIDDQGYDVKE
ncbi:copper chaperone CopZ [Bacillus mangrovi]|uniref:Copper chaperone CopZ n=1 Tax=Metabacillus mangrovi TaxID=1491830 RepID=A0A7X2V3F1_9BACI|nr:copper chaperone CopZ [Metabacillus mangrovi]MTH51931.1 copper chaperone CopZ [Metabacillus mangrovi]